MKNSKGFTLIELLAVIIILAIVALVTTPAILNVINDSRLNGAKDKAWGTIDAVKLSYTQKQYATESSTAGDNFALPIVVTFTASGSSVTCANSSCTLPINLNGEKPVEGTVTIDKNTGVITCKNLKFVKNGTYYCKSDNGTDMECQTTKYPES